MLGCDEVERLMSDFQDGVLPPSRRFAIRFHLLMCRSCRALERSMRETLHLVRGLRDEDVSSVGNATEADGHEGRAPEEE